MKRLVIFDLDGTLLNTIADLGMASNYALKLHHFPQHDLAEYQHFVGNGITKLLERALPENARTTEMVQQLRTSFVKYYSVHNCDLTQPYDGVVELLENLQNKGIQLAVASNKYQAATEKLVQYFFPHIPFVAIYGQRDNVPLKPNPQIVKDIMAVAHVTADDTLYVGDSDIDMQTTQNAGVESVGVTWGFCSRERLTACTPAHLVDSAREILELI